MENTNENKAKFFAQYYGQEVQKYKNEHHEFTVNVCFMISIDNAYLELTPLSDISDEQCMQLIEGTNYENGSIEWVKRVIGSLAASSLFSDKLRCMGFAMPWNGITVEEQVKRGWTKLKTK